MFFIWHIQKALHHAPLQDVAPNLFASHLAEGGFFSFAREKMNHIVAVEADKNREAQRQANHANEAKEFEPHKEGDEGHEWVQANLLAHDAWLQNITHNDNHSVKHNHANGAASIIHQPRDNGPRNKDAAGA